MEARKWSWCLASLAVLFGGLVWCWTLLPARAPEPEARGTTAAARPVLAGTSSCSGRACHGSPEPEAKAPFTGAEFTLWSLHDRHTRAYDVLLTKRSDDIVTKLGLGKKAHEEERCLACHTTPQAALADTPFTSERPFGVGCESCHGPASRWLSPHTAPKKWAALKEELGPVKVEEDYGMNGLDNLARRTEVCAGCHIGAPADPARGLPLRDMNHDFIAAGHPRLNFEMASFQDNMPRHWQEKKREPTFEAKVWAVGQIVSLQCSLELLADRARHEKDETRPWPEFSESDCYACHHALDAPSWRSKRGYPNREPGAEPWSHWYREMPQLLAARDKDKEGASVVDALRALAKQMNGARPDRHKVAEEALDLARNKLKPWAAKWNAQPLSEADVRSLRAYLTEHVGKNAPDDWDNAWQDSIALLTLDQALRQSRMPTVPLTEQQQQVRRNLIKILTLPRGFDSPSAFRIPADFDDKLRELLKQLVSE